MKEETVIKPVQRQRGASTLGTIIGLALLAYGAWVCIQYVPIWVESRSVDATLSTVVGEHRVNPMNSTRAVEDALAKALNINEMNDKRNLFSVQQLSEGIVIRAEYDRDLDLLFTTRELQYRKSVTLR